MIYMANKPFITKVSRVFLGVYEYTARVSRIRKSAIISISLAALAAAIVPAGRAQDIGGTVRITPVPNGAYYGVDGVFYNHPTSFIWPQGSKHTLTAEVDSQGDFGTHYDFTSWSVQ